MRPHLYKRACPSVGKSVRPSVMLLSKIAEIRTHSEGRGRGNDEDDTVIRKVARLLYSTAAIRNGFYAAELIDEAY